MLNPRQLIEDSLEKWLKSRDISVEFEVSLSQNLQFGDFSSNISLIASKKIENSNPRQLAEEIISSLQQNTEIQDIFEKIEPAGPGFINFYLKEDYLLNMLTEVAQDGTTFGTSSNVNPPTSHQEIASQGGQKTVVEFGDPNPFKEIHIGHLRNFCIGESFSKLLESQGNEVIRANYQGDVGMHVAKCLWGIMQRIADSEELTVKDLAEGYILGAKMFEEDENAKKEITELNKKVYNDDPEIKPLWEAGRKVSLDHFEELYKRAGIHYDKYYFESSTAKKGKEIVLSHIDDGVFEKSDGAVVYRGEKDGLHTRVFLTSQDYATYEGKDLALAILKNEDIAYDQSVVLTGNEQLEYFHVMLAALKKISPDLASKTKHLTFGHVRLKEGKMSSRTGDVITASWLLDEAVSRVKTAFTDMDEDTANKVGIGSVKYSMLKFSIPADIHFSFEESITLEGNSGPYLQYAYVRTQSVLSKSENQELRIKNEEVRNLEKEESELLRFLTQYPYHVTMAAQDFAPNLLCNYLFELSQKYNLFYQKCKIIGGEKETFRLFLTKAVGNVLKNGLTILGIETVEKM